MYKMYDKAAAIREIQAYLKDAQTTKVSVVTNGIFDENTREAVIAFQKNNSINPSGKVDYNTFSALYQDYVKRQLSEETNVIPWQNIKFPLKLGDYGEDIRMLNKLLSMLLDFYKLAPLRDSGLFSEATNTSQASLRKIFGMENGDFDRLFLRRLLTEVEAIKEI